jgi:hypothetical protein
VICPLCGERRARRGCPALGKQICSVCCGTKRLVEIQCPADCPYLASAREHPAAAVVRQQQRDITLVAQLVRDFNDRQSQLFFVLTTFLLRYESRELQPIIDADVAEGAAAVAGTFETAARGVIYEHRPASLPADRLATAIKAMLAEAGENAPASFDRDAAVVLRRIEQAIGEARPTDPTNRRAWLDLIGRVIRPSDQGPDSGARPEAETPRLIVP